MGRLRMENFPHRLHAQRDAHVQDHRRHRRGIDVLQPPVAEGMLLVRRLCGIVKSHHQKHHGPHIGDVIEPVAHDREETALPAGKNLHRPQDQIHQKPNQSHPHRLPRAGLKHLRHRNHTYTPFKKLLITNY